VVQVFARASRLATSRLRFVALALIAVGVACRDDAPTSLLKPRAAALHATAPGPSVEFYFHGSVEDWPIFMGNVAAASVQTGHKVVFTISTAGDGGQAAAFWQKREAGGQASLNALVGAGSWTCAAQVTNGHSLRRCTKANVVLYFMRMPDGNYWDGTGFGKGSLSNLRDEGVATAAIDNSTTYASWNDYTTTLRSLISFESQGQAASAVLISAPDYDRTINPGDHPDNAATADAVHAATQGMGWTMAFWVDYQSENLAINLSQADHDTKRRIFLAYDSVMVAAKYASDANDPETNAWLWRTYYRVSSPTPPPAPTALTAKPSSKSRIDLSWTDNASNESGFYVERAPDVAGGAGTFIQIGGSPVNTPTYSDLTVAPGTKYWYRVRAYNDAAASDYTNAASATTPTSQPLPYRGDAYIVAHADDWQIFDGDHAVASFGSAASMLFVYATAGDAGNPAAYWKQREKGTLASIDAVIGAGTWACANTTIRSHVIWRCTKNATVVYFMRMPDGNYVDGTGYGLGSLTNLRNGTPVQPVDGSTTYTTWTDFYTTLGAIVDLEFDGQSSPYIKIHAQEYDKTLDPKDHPDHNATGDAVRTIAASHLWDLEYFIGYDTENRAVNITTPQHTQKLNVWTPYDNTMVAGGYPSDVIDPEYQLWVWRTYTRTINATTQSISAPTALGGAAASGTEIDLTWTDNSNNETSFSIERAPDNAGAPGTYAVVGSVGANVTTFANTGLTAGTTYWYRVQALNATGSSAYSNALAVAVLAPPAAPSALTLSVQSSTQINLAWTDNASNETGFAIERAPDVAGGAGTYVQIATVGANITSYFDTGLTASTAYWYRVRATNAGGNSAYSNAIAATTQAPAPPPPPTAPSGLTLTAASPTQINLGWTDNSADETGFSIERAPDNAGTAGTYAVVTSVAANATSYQNTGLTASTTYWYRVRAFNANGNSTYTTAVSVATLAPPPPPPNAPSGLTLAPVSPTQINLSWTDNSSDETSFIIERAPDVAGGAGTFAPIATVGANVTSYSSTGLTASTTYWYRVQASNANGSSAYSAAVSASTPQAPPAAPTVLALAAVSSSQINLTWTDNATNETGFSIERAPDNAGTPGTFAQIATVGANVASYNNTGLAASTTYWYRVRAFNGSGNSGYTNAASAATLAPPPPAAPGGLTLSAASPTQINLTWADNSSDETSFSIERAPDVAGGAGTFAPIATVGANVTSYSNTGLTPNTTYWYRVQASNANGNSAYSAAVSAATPQSLPTAPTALAAAGVSTSQINLTWTDNANNETGFSVERAPDNAGTPGTFAAIAAVGANTTSYNNTGLPANTTYWYRVRAGNAVGNSGYTNAVPAATAPLPPPAAPSGLTLGAASSTQINLAWADNSSDETSFNIERAPDNAGSPGAYSVIASVGANATSYSNSGLTPNTRYWYRVQASNANGNSGYSNETAAATLQPAPAAPSGLSTSAASATQINLAWTDNANNETGFRVERAPDAGGVAGTYTEIAVVGVNVNSYSSTGLTAGATYWFRVRAYNGTGTSAYSNESSATTPLPQPLAPTGLTANATTSTTIVLGWSDNATNETAYLVERAPDNGGVAGTYAQVASLAANSTGWTDTGRSSSTTYWYRVRASGPVNSDYSNVVSATTPAPPPGPVPPSNLVATTISSTEIDLSWTDNSSDETSFIVQRAPDVGGSPGTYATITTLSANVTTYKNTGLTLNTPYWYRVSASNVNGTSAAAEASGATANAAPAAPSTFAAKPTISALTAALTWKDNSTNELGFRIEQAPDVSGVSGTFTEIATVGPNVTAFTAAGLTGFTKYWYRIRSYNSVGTSAYATKVSVLTSQPTDLTIAQVTGNGQRLADVEWVAASGGHVDIYRDGVKVLSNFTDSGSWWDWSSTTGHTYVYQICNTGFTGPSQCSNTMSITL
jgi:titin